MRTSKREPFSGHASGRDVGQARPAATYRSASARPVAAGVWVCATAALIWLVADGDPHTVSRAAPWLALASWFVYVSQWRPCLRVEATGFDVVNGVRDHRIPFTTVTDIEVRFTTVIYAAGRKYVSWGAPTPPSAFGAGFGREVELKSRPFTVLPSNERISQPEARTGRDDIVAAWQQARSAGGTAPGGAVASTWSAPVIVVGLLSVGAVIASAFL